MPLVNGIYESLLTVPFTGLKMDRKTYKPYCKTSSRERWRRQWSGEGARRRGRTRTCPDSDLRHTAITHMIEQDVPLSIIAQLIGWSPSTTVQMAIRYGHFCMKTLHAAVARIGAIEESRPISRPAVLPGARSDQCCLSCSFYLVASQGFEPRLIGSEPTVLPLNEEATG